MLKEYLREQGELDSGEEQREEATALEAEESAAHNAGEPLESKQDLRRQAGESQAELVSLPV